MTIVRGHNVVFIPFLCRKPFNQNTALYAISSISWWGSFSDTRVFGTLILTFTVLIHLSISGTCLSRTVVWTLMPVISIGFLMHSNCMSARMYHALKPLPLYVLITCWSDFIIVAFLLSLIIFMVPSRNALYSVMSNGISFMYIISTVSVTLPCSSNIPSGRLLSVLSITFDGFLLLGLPFRDLSFGPSMSSALRMLLFVMGQFGIKNFSTYSIYSFVLSLPIISCKDHALCASNL